MFTRLIMLFIFIALHQNFLLANELEIESEPSTDSILVKDVSRFSDLDQEVYFFNVTLENNHTFKIEVSLEDLLNHKIYQNQAFKLASENFEPEEPGLSHFIYTSQDEEIVFEGKFPSIQSHWIPKDSPEEIEVIKKDGYWAMGTHYYFIYFSDGSVMRERDTFLNTNEGDKYFRVQSPEGKQVMLLVGVKDGRVILKGKTHGFVPVNFINNLPSDLPEG